MVLLYKRLKNMEILLNNPVYMWLAFGAALILIEVFTVPGLGLFLGGIGAITTGILITVKLIDANNIIEQISCFFGVTTITTIILWRTIKKFRIRQAHKNPIQLNNMVGATAIIGKDGLKKDQLGQAHWSGTIMNAILDAQSKVDFLPADSQVTIKSVTGTTLIVIEK